MTKKIMLFSRDPGGANVVAPLYNKLKDRGYTVLVYGKDIALDKYKQYGFEGIDILEKINNISEREIEEFLTNESPDFLITGTSADDYTEKYLWKAANKLDIKSFAILDQWTNYGVRFSEFSVCDLNKYEKNKKHPYLPYKILVMDDFAKLQMIKEGISDEKVIVSGQPYFDYLLEKKDKLENDNLMHKKEKGCTEDEFLIAFVSEPISNIYKETDESKHYWGYSERTIFRHFINALKYVTELYKKKVKLIIRLHPKENENNYDDIIDLIDSKYISTMVDRKMDGFNLMCASDLIAGMSSMFLIESVVVGKPVLSIQIGLKRENPFILDKKKIIKSVLTLDELKENLFKILIKNHTEEYRFEVKKGASENVINFMEAIIWEF